MTSLRQHSTIVWGFPGTTAGTTLAVDIIDDAPAAKHAELPQDPSAYGPASFVGHPEQEQK